VVDGRAVRRPRASGRLGAQLPPNPFAEQANEGSKVTFGSHLSHTQLTLPKHTRSEQVICWSGRRELNPHHQLEGWLKPLPYLPICTLSCVFVCATSL